MVDYTSQSLTLVLYIKFSCVQTNERNKHIYIYTCLFIHSKHLEWHRPSAFEDKGFAAERSNFYLIPTCPCRKC
ncbi:mCG147879, partial [Mus musculus]